MFQELWDLIPSLSETITFAKQQMQTNQFFQTAGFFGVIGVIATRGKSAALAVWQRIYRLIYYKATIEETSSLFPYIDKYLYFHYKNKFRNVLLDIETISKEEDSGEVKETIHSPPLKESKPVGAKYEDNLLFKQLDDTIFLWKGGILPISIFNGREKLENANSLTNAFLNRYVFSGIFAKRRINKLIDEILEFKKNEEYSRNKEVVEVHSNSQGKSYWSQESSIEPKDFDLIISEKKNKIYNSIVDFTTKESFYKERGIMYKRGYLLEGPPGTGKTSLVLALAKKLKMSLYILNPSGISDSDLIYLYKNIPKNSILLIEDVDSVFRKDRTQQNDKIKFNYNTLLNCMDGALSVHGLITIFTTNFKDRLDEALIREGRIDEEFHIGYANKNHIVKYLNVFYKATIKGEVIKDTLELPICKVQEECLRNMYDHKITINNLNKLNHERVKSKEVPETSIEGDKNS